MTSNKIQLFHISSLHDGGEEKTVFTPRIPRLRAVGEDETMERICVSSTLEGCFIGHPTAVNSVHTGLEDRVYLLERGKEAMIFRVYGFEVEKEKVRMPEELHEKGYVPDALLSQEHWILEPCQPVSISYVVLENVSYQIGTKEFTFTYTEHDTYGEWGEHMDGDLFQDMQWKLKKGAYRNKNLFTKEEAFLFKQDMDVYFNTPYEEEEEAIPKVVAGIHSVAEPNELDF